MPADHILTYARDLAGGGVERAQLRLAGGWVAGGRCVTLVIGRAAGPLRPELPDGVATIELDTTSMPALARALPGLARRLAPDVIFCPGNHYTGVAAWVRLRLGGATPPIVGKLSNAVRRADHAMLTDLGHRWWLGRHGRFLDHLVAMTPATAREAERAMNMAGRVSIIPNPPAPRLHPAPLPSAPLPPPLPSRFVLGVGRLARQKRWDRLIAAMPADVPLVIAGEGPERDALAMLAGRAGIALHLPGHLPDPLALMARAAVLVLPSDFEGVPGVLAEALSVGTPVVATDCGPAIREIVTSPALGTVVPRDDPAALAAAVRAWLAPGATRPALVPRTGEDSAARYLDLFDRLVAQA